MVYFSGNVNYSPLQAIVVRLEDKAEIRFDIIPAKVDQEDDVSWDNAQNCAWDIAERVAEYLNSNPEDFNLGRDELWRRVRTSWYTTPLLDYDAIDEKAELEEARYEWLGFITGK